MAEQIIFEVTYDTKDAEKNIDNLTASITDLEGANKDLKKTNKELEKDAQKISKDRRENSKLFKALTQEINNNSKELAKNQQQLSKEKAERRDNIKVVQSEVKSLDGLRAANTKLTKQRNKLDISTKEGQRRFARLNKEIKNNTQALKQAEQAGGDFRRSVGDYRGQLEAIPGPIGGVISGIQAITRASLAFIATPIGAVIGAIGLALGSLTAFFKSSEKGQNALNKVSAVFSTIIGNLVDVISDFGEAIFEAVTSPRETISKLGDLIQQNLINRFKAFAVIGDAIVKILKGDFVEGFNQLAEGGFQAITGIEDAIDKTKNLIDATKDSITELIKETDKEIEIAKALADSQAALDVQIRESLIKRAQLNRDIQKLRVEAKDSENNTDEERLSLLREAIKLEEEILSLDVQIAAEKVRIKEEQNALSNSTKEDLNEEAQLRAELFNVEAQNFTKRRALVAEEQALIKRNQEEIRKAAEQESVIEQEKLDQLNELRGAQEEFEAEQREMKEESELERQALERERLTEFTAFQLQQFDEVLEANGFVVDERIKMGKSLLQNSLSISKQIADGEKVSADTIAGTATELTNLLFSLDDDRKIKLEADRNERLAAFDAETQKIIEDTGATGQAVVLIEAQRDAKRKELEQEFAKEKDKLALREFRQGKAAALIDIAIQTAIGISKSLAASPVTGGLPFSAIIAALGAVQAGVVLSQKPPPKTASFEKGGEIKTGVFGGERHSAGGTNIYDGGGSLLANVERGERFFVMNRDASAQLNYLSTLNESTGGRPLTTKSRFNQEGGEVPVEAPDPNQLADTVEAAIRRVPIQVSVTDINLGQQAVSDVKNVGVV